MTTEDDKPGITWAQLQELDASWATSMDAQGKRQHFQDYLQAQGSAPITDADLRQRPDLVELVAIGQDWVSSAKRIPREDNQGLLYYLVYTNYCDGFLQCCQFENWRWRMGENTLSLSDVKFWRLAAVGERDSREATAAEKAAIRRLRGWV